MMEVNGNSESNARSKFVFAKSAIYLPKCAIFSGSSANTAQRHKIWK